MLTLLTILFYLFIVVGLINLAHIVFYLIGANLYDVRAYYISHNKGNNLREYKPLVSVLIPAFNEELVIERSLQSVWNNTYDNIELIVINDGSHDGTSETVQRYINSRTRAYREDTPKLSRTKFSLKREWKRGKKPMYRRIKLVEKSNGGKASALNRGLKYHARGELIMTLDADSLIHKNAIANVIKYFDNPKVAGVAANVRIIEKPSVIGMLQRFEHMIGYRSKKFFTLANCELIVGGVGSTYRRSVLDVVGNYDTDTITEDIGLSIKIAAQGNKKYRLVYASDVTAMTEGVSGFKALLNQRYRWKLGNLQNIIKYRSMTFSKDSRYTKSMTWYRMPMAFLGELLILLEPVALSYVMYLSIKYATIGMFLGAYMTITIYILLTIWPDEHMTFWNKVKASMYAPVLYFVFYLMNVVQLFSILKCLVNRKEIVNLSTAKGTWISPERAGGTATFT
jgi:poly-beta-1,6-N-acetyl-D-glucosamine synthase